MAKKSMIAKAARKPKFTVRGYTRCQICGRPHSVYKDFGICRVCLRKMANEGLIPGLKKASWQGREMLNDLISDGLTRIRNAAMRRLETTKLLHSNVVEATLSILAAKGYIESYNVVEEDKKKFINVVLKYDEHGRSVINELKRVSSPGRRVYKGKDEIKRFKNGYGTIIVSTSKGVLSNEDAHKAGVGGEILCSVW